MRELGGLYVLGTERHESRRIDNQLRGRSGRQGDPGESRFYLSLEDELMRLFATGAMNWVMGKAFPDDVPLEAKMVTKAIERAQRTVEDRNFEIRKDVLKYDEVMNEQRKVIYRRRQQILDGGDLRDEAFEAIDGGGRARRARQLRRASSPRTGTSTSSHRQMQHDLSRRASRASSSTTRTHRDALVELLADDAVELYEAKEAGDRRRHLREIERRVMLSMIDQHWREHLYEMDYLREGINLRAMGQKDPLAEWQREGFDMFEAMMGQIQDDFVALRLAPPGRRGDEAPRRPRPELRYTRGRGPGPGLGGAARDRRGDARRGAASASFGADAAAAADGVGRARPRTSRMEPVRVEKTPGRNEPCYCGSGKKYKLCHGR